MNTTSIKLDRYLEFPFNAKTLDGKTYAHLINLNRYRGYDINNNSISQDLVDGTLDEGF
ncbi:hypothetical protein [Vallitalea guaymasensis]|uniref:hypothetical protein n=1 Tax=Vallitalea guaymasensis TaxID=1185412 RepID=UPI002357B66A|nr:hypothetical protein [Vallitalea guaymasensis]